MAEMNLLQMSIYGGLLILVILAVRAIFAGRIQKQVFVLLWCVALLRLLVPFALSSPVSAYSLLGPEMERLQAAAQGTGSAQDSENVQRAENLNENSYGWVPGRPDGQAVGQDMGQLDEQQLAGGHRMESMSLSPAIAPEASEPGLSVVSWLWRIWAAGAILCAVAFGITYLICLREFRMALPVDNNLVMDWVKRQGLRRRIKVRQSDRIQTPLTYGIMHPVILLPKALVQEEDGVEHVLLHECQHIRWFDNGLKLIQAAAVCVHWFNPLAWVMYLMLNRDIELACDERVLGSLGEGKRSDYAATLLRLEARKSGLLAGFGLLYNGFGKSDIERRIKLITKYRKKTWRAAAAGVSLAAVIVVCFATSAVQAENKENGQSDQSQGEDVLAENQPMRTEGYTVEPLDEAAVEENQAIGYEWIPAGTSGTATESHGPVLIYIAEGMGMTVPATRWLAADEEYSILIPEESWTLDEYTADFWKCESNMQVRLWVRKYEGQNCEQEADALMDAGFYRMNGAEDRLRQEADGLFTTGQLVDTDNVDILEGVARVCEVRLFETEEAAWAVYWTCPAEVEEDFSPVLRTMVNSFQAPATMAAEPMQFHPIDEESPIMDGLRLIDQFTRAYMTGDQAGMRECMMEELWEDCQVYSGNVDEAWITVVSSWRHYLGAETLKEPKGDHVIRVEIQPERDVEDTFYLYLEVTWVSDGWKVSGYALQ